MRRTLPWCGGVLVALAAIGSCGKDKTTALDIKLEITGNLDQVRIDMVTLDGDRVSLTGEPTTMFPVSPKMLETGDVLTLWFPDSDDTKTVVVSATGRLCGRDASPQAMTPGRKLAKGTTVQTTLALANDGTVCAGTGTGGGGGTGGMAGTGGAAGGGGTAATGSGGTGGTAGRGGSGNGGAGTGGGAGGAAGTTGSAGTGGGASGRGGTAGSAGAGGGAAGRGGTTGSAGAGGGAAGRGGTMGAAGAGGAAGRGGTTGSGGAAGRGGTTGTGGTAAGCATPPSSASAQLGAFQPGLTTTTCGYPVQGTQVQYLLTGSDFWAIGNAPAMPANQGGCGRCLELVRTIPGAIPTRVTVTVVGGCPDAACQTIPTPRFELSASAYQVLAPAGDNVVPGGAGETLTYSYVPCPVAANPPILANLKVSNGVVASVLFVEQRYGITSVTVEDVTTAQQTSLARLNDAYWWPPTGMLLPGSARFRLTDVNNATVTSAVLTTANTAPFSSAGIQFPLCPSP